MILKVSNNSFATSLFEPLDFNLYVLTVATTFLSFVICPDGD
jgi:hypothetical protein